MVDIALLSTITINISKVLILIGIIFIIWKMITKVKKKPSNVYEKSKKIFYNLHKAGPGIALILSFVHGLTIEPINQTYVITGWIFGGLMLLLTGSGIFLGFQSKWTPFNEDQDAHYKIIRIIKWVLTVFLIAALILHYFL
ncbi:MAG: hypothetical protein FK734_08885 [Asgard group archaeon]|nr:hypothetical protein [Asgard group archaeon]